MYLKLEFTFNTFHANGQLLYSLKTSESLFCDILRGIEIGIGGIEVRHLTQNSLITGNESRVFF